MNSKVVEDFVARTERFRQRVRALGFHDATNYYWYHTIDLGDGLITPGIYDYRETLPAFGFPSELNGMTVLDVGSATGFFAFEFERRGARVISVELPSLEGLDRFPGQTTEQLLKKLERMILPISSDETPKQGRGNSKDELYFYLLDGPFRFCYMQLDSKVERCFSTVYELSAQKLGLGGSDAGFDLIFLGDVLLHTFYPWKALAAIAPLCKSDGLLVLSQIMPEDLGSHPAMLYVGGSDPDGDDISWWWPNKLCFEQMLKKLGFREVQEVGRSTGILQSTGYPFDRTILHARK